MATVSGKYLKVIRVFIASPNDLSDERKMFPDVLAKVNEIKAKSKGILLEPLGWEDTLPGRGRPQEKINQDVKRSDLIVMLLWKRWGTSTGKYSSGFEEEYEVALHNEKDIWLYFRSIPDDMLADPGEQLRKVLEFRNRIETEKKLLFRIYEDGPHWKERFMDDLCRWLDDLPPASFELEKLTEYPKRIEQLERDLEEVRSKQIDIARTLARDGQEQANSGHITKAEEYFAKALTIYPEPSILNDYGLFLMRIGVLQKAEEKFVQLMQTSQIMGNKTAEAISYGNLGILYQTRGDLKAAEEMYRKSLAIDEELGRKEGMAASYGNLGILYQTRGDLKAAEEMYRKSLAIFISIGNKAMIRKVRSLIKALKSSTSKNETR